jgi:two-component system, chemotaxis family, protein-glutamate methylesterase/glutaminase
LSEKRLLVVSETQTNSSFLEEYFQRLGSGYSVQWAHSVPEAVDIISADSIDLVISDHQGSEKINGLQLLEGVARIDLPVRVILASDAERADDRTVALSMGCTVFLVEPYPRQELAHLLFGMLQPEQGFAGRVVSMKLEDVIQMFCYKKDSTLLSVFAPAGNGRIYVDDGGIVHAEYDSLLGVEAFHEILGWESGTFLSQVVLSVPQRTIFMDWQTLLMESLRQKDEIRHALAPVKTLEAGYAAAGSSSVTVAANAAKATHRAERAPLKRVMVVDDSRFIRKIVQEIVQSDLDLKVAGYAANGQEALAKIDELKPDLILLDWDMPVMKGSTTLMHIMIRSPCPVVILSGFVGGVGANPFDLLCLGAVDFLRKPQSNWRVDGKADDLVRRIKDACASKFEFIRRIKVPPVIKPAVAKPDATIPASFLSIFGSSTGGCTDLIRIVPSLKEDLPAALIVLHDMQKETIEAFVDYLDKRSRIRVRCLEPGVPLRQGVVYVHPMAVPSELVREGNHLSARNPSDTAGARVLDHFLMSAARIMGRDVVAVLLSGRPEDGVDGLKAVKEVGGITMVQDPSFSLDPRMAESALQEGIVDHICAADRIAATLLDLVRQEMEP